MNQKKESFIFFTVIFILIGLSIGVAYYRYMVLKDFVYFSAEEQIPDQFSPSSYSKL